MAFQKRKANIINKWRLNLHMKNFLRLSALTKEELEITQRDIAFGITRWFVIWSLSLSKEY